MSYIPYIGYLSHKNDIGGTHFVSPLTNEDNELLDKIDRVKLKLEAGGLKSKIIFLPSIREIVHMRGQEKNSLLKLNDDLKIGGILKFVINRDDVDLDIACHFSTHYMWEAGFDSHLIGYEDCTCIFDEEDEMIKTILKNLKKNKLI